MKLFRTVLEWLARHRNMYHAARQQRREHNLDNMSRDTINVIEFNGRLYVAYRGVPVVRTDHLNSSVPELLTQSRQDYLAWKDKFNQ